MTMSWVGQKTGMTRVYTDDGQSIPVTVVKLMSEKITQIKTKEQNNYSAIQVAVGSNKVSRLSKPLIGQIKKAGVESARFLREITLPAEDIADMKLSDSISYAGLDEGCYVDVSGITKGKGFAGPVKRHHFHMQDATHGNSLSHRAHGSVGQCQTPGRVYKGKKMAGHMGDVKRTVQNIQVVQINQEKSYVLVRGAIPGANGGIVILKPSIKAKGDKK